MSDGECAAPSTRIVFPSSLARFTTYHQPGSHAIVANIGMYLDNLVFCLGIIKPLGPTFKRLSPIPNYLPRLIRQMFATFFKSDNFHLQSGHFLRSSRSSNTQSVFAVSSSSRLEDQKPAASLWEESCISDGSKFIIYRSDLIASCLLFSQHGHGQPDRVWRFFRSSDPARSAGTLSLPLVT